MTMPKIPPAYLWMGGAALLALYVLTRQGVAKGLAQGAAEAVVGTVTDAAAGVVIGGAKALGIPETNADACTLALADGDYLKASFVCPASRYAGAVFGRDFEAEKLKFIRDQGA